MKSKIHLVLLFVFIAAGVTSCSKDDDKDDAFCTEAWAVTLSDELNALAAAAIAYDANPTSANCIAQKNAKQAYLNALKPFGNCALLTGQNRVAWENELAEAQEDLDNSEC